MAPEVIKSHQYGKKVDIWSLGILAVEMQEVYMFALKYLISYLIIFQGHPPYMKETPMKAMYLIASRGKPEIKSWVKMSVAFQSFLDKALVFNPTQRLSAEDLLSQPFLSTTSSLKTIKPNIEAARKKKEELARKK